LSQARGIKQGFATAFIHHAQANVVARLGFVSVRRIRWRVTDQWNCFELKVVYFGNGECVVEFEWVPVDTAVVFQNIEQGVTGGQIFFDQGVTPQGQMALVFTQHQQPGCMVDLRIHEHDRRNACVAQRTCWLQLGQGFELLKNIGGRIHQKPILGIR